MEQFNTILAIFFMLALGYIAKKAGYLKEEDIGVINKIILYLCLPAFVINGVMGSKLNMAMFITPGAGVICEGIVLCVAFLICKLFKFNKDLTYGVMLCSAFANTGFLGYPVVSSLFNSRLAMPSAVIFDQFGMQFFLVIIAPILASWILGKNQEISKTRNFFELFKKPVFPVLILSLIFHNIKMPEFFMMATGMLGKSIVPLAMMVIGLNLKTSSIFKYIKPLFVVICLKLLLLPLLMYFLLTLLDIDGTVLKVVVLQASLATAVLSGILVAENKGDGTFASSAIFVTTLLDVAMIPLVASILKIG